MSLRRTLTIVSLLGGAIVTAAPAQNMATYAPGTRRYHLISVITRGEDQNGQHSEFKITNEQIVSVILAHHAGDTLDFSYTMDSSTIVADPPIELPDISKMKGTRVHGVMSPSGKVYHYTSSAEPNDPDMQNLVEGMSRFLVPLPERAHVGSTWVDTTNNAVEQNGAHLDLKTITTSTILGDTTYNRQRAWRVHRAAALTIAGSQAALGQSLTIDGHGSGEGVYYISSDGVFLGSAASQTMAMNISEKETGKTIPVTQAVTSRVELLH